MFYIWHTAIITVFLIFVFFLGYELGIKKTNTKKPTGKCPFGFDKEE